MYLFAVINKLRFGLLKKKKIYSSALFESRLTAVNQSGPDSPVQSGGLILCFCGGRCEYFSPGKDLLTGFFESVLSRVFSV